MSGKTAGEMLFEEYLRYIGVADFEFEAEFPRTGKKPDYTFMHSGIRVVLDVKDFRGEPRDFKPGFRAYDPYRPIRQKINVVARQFKDLKEHACAAVLYNHDKPLVSLKPLFVYGAMLGNLGIQIPVNLGRGIPADAKTRSVFTTGGKMIRYGANQKPIEPQNTTISAVLALGKLLVGQKACMKWLNEAEKAQGRKMTFEEHLEVIESWQGTDKDISRSELRVITYENPYARIPWPKNLFSGQWDERYGIVNGGFIRRLYAGQALRDLERLIGENPELPDL